MKVEVHLHATLRIESAEGRGQVILIELSDASTLDELWQILSIDLDPAHLLFVRNGKTADLDQKLVDGDVINIMTGLSGG